MGEEEKPKLVVKGEVIDRSAGGAIGFLLAFVILRIFGIDPSGIQAAGVYGYSGALGAQIGAKVPAEYSSMLSNLFYLIAIIAGATAGLPQVMPL